MALLIRLICSTREFSNGSSPSICCSLLGFFPRPSGLTEHVPKSKFRL